MKQYFEKKGKEAVLTEQEFVNKQGELYRCDRVVFENGTITVIDFKTGGAEKESEYTTQVRNYMGILQEVYPLKKVQGCIAYVDLHNIVQVN